MKKMLVLLVAVGLMGCEWLPQGEDALDACTSKERIPSFDEAEEYCETVADCHTVDDGDWESNFDICLGDLTDEDTKYPIKLTDCAIVAAKERNKGNLKCWEFYQYTY